MKAGRSWHGETLAAPPLVFVDLATGDAFDVRTTNHLPIVIDEVFDDGRIVARVKKQTVTLWHHHPDRVRELLGASGPCQTWSTQPSLLIVSEYGGESEPAITGHQYLSVAVVDGDVGPVCP
jgi:hypothetical protein